MISTCPARWCFRTTQMADRVFSNKVITEKGCAVIG
jgi:hypothetical protein